ncbi:MAG: FIG00457688: hypothetical protein [uncultured Paraburkholderia sp.]|nr:MAG: FIG00457688: hypothetical protein [uncultured Paraburkholderia sp.]
MSEDVQRLNYSTHALEQFEQLIPTIRRDMPGMRAGYEAVAHLLRISVKYLLPNCADLIDVSELRQVHIDSMRLPHPVAALEAPWVLPRRRRRRQGYPALPEAHRLVRGTRRGCRATSAWH